MNDDGIVVFVFIFGLIMIIGLAIINPIAHSIGDKNTEIKKLKNDKHVLQLELDCERKGGRMVSGGCYIKEPAK